MANENLKKQMVVKLGTTTNTEAQLISNMVDGALSGKGGNDPELENLKKQMVIKLGTTTNEDAQIISNMVDNAAGGGGGGLSNPVLTINVDATGVSGEVGTLPLFSNNNGVLQIANGVVNGGSSSSYETLTIEWIYGEESSFGWNGIYYADAVITSTALTLSTSNAVNCEIYLDQQNSFFSVMVVDPTQPASFTLTVS